jgi:hypothetical protein
MDAGALLREWVGAGGLPPLVIEFDPNRGWTTPTTGPVPWSVCAAAPPALSLNNFSPGYPLESLRMYPSWPDRAGYGRARNPEERFPSGARGPFGKQLHAVLLGLMAERPHPKGRDWTFTVRLMAWLGRLDPAILADVMTLPRMWREPGYDVSSRDEYGALAHAFQRVFEAGGMVGSWAGALAVAASGCRDADAGGLAELFRMLATYAVEVPRPRASVEVLDTLRTYAAQPDKDANHKQVRLLVSALED